jgi:hypothetical protein
MPIAADLSGWFATMTGRVPAGQLSPRPQSEKTQAVIGSVFEDMAARERAERPVTPPRTLAAEPVLSSRLAAHIMVLVIKVSNQK